MYRSALLIASLISCISANAQSPVLWQYTAGWNPGDSINFTSALNPETISSGAEGSNITWDFSNLVADGPYIYNTLAWDPNNTPYGPNFPAAHYARMPVANWYYFYDVNTATLDYLGYQGPTETMVLSDPLTLFYFPMQYGDFHADSAFATYTSNGSQYEYNTNNTIEADSYGTLILPDATYTDVVRLKVTTNEHFEGQDVQDSRGVFTDTWYWYSATVRGTLLFIANETEDDNGTISQEARVNYRASLISGVEQPEQLSDVRLYPNPSNCQLNLEYQLRTSSQVSIAITDLAGKQVIGLENGWQSAGAQRYTPDLSGLTSGMYLLNMELNGQRMVQKIAVQ